MKGKKISILVLASLAGIALMVVHAGVLAPTHLIAADVHDEKTPGKPAVHVERAEAKAKPVANGEHKYEDERQDGAEDGHKDEKVVHLTDADLKKFDIEAATAGPGKLKTHLSLSGEISVNADRMAHIVPRMPGVVREVRKNLGDRVQQGELMAVIASRELADAKAEYLAAREKVALAQAKFSREEGLWKKKISAEQEYLDARQALAEARITQRSAEQKLHALGFSHDYLKQLPQHLDKSFTRYEIVAPFNGTVIEKHITLGEVLKEDAEAFVIADLSSVWVNLNVYQKDLVKVRNGQSVTVSTGHDTNETESEIVYVGPLVKEETRTVLARVVLANSRGEWRPGMFVTARLAVDEVTVPLLVPKTALQTIDEKTVVFVKTEEGFEPKAVTLGRTNDADVEITAGISSGDRYAVTGAFTLKAQLSKGAFGDGHNH